MQGSCHSISQSDNRFFVLAVIAVPLMNPQNVYRTIILRVGDLDIIVLRWRNYENSWFVLSQIENEKNSQQLPGSSYFATWSISRANGGSQMTGALSLVWPNLSLVRTHVLWDWSGFVSVISRRHGRPIQNKWKGQVRIVNIRSMNPPGPFVQEIHKREFIRPDGYYCREYSSSPNACS